MIDETIVREQLGALFTFTIEPYKSRIRTPFRYPDGEVIDLFLTHDSTRLSDEGRSRDYTWTHVTQEGFINQRKLLSDLEVTYGIHHERSELYVPVRDEQSLAKAIIQLATACIAFVSVVIGQI